MNVMLVLPILLIALLAAQTLWLVIVWYVAGLIFGFESSGKEAAPHDPQQPVQRYTPVDAGPYTSPSLAADPPPASEGRNGVPAVSYLRALGITLAHVALVMGSVFVLALLTPSAGAELVIAAFAGVLLFHLIAQWAAVVALMPISPTRGAVIAFFAALPTTFLILWIVWAVQPATPRAPRAIPARSISAPANPAPSPTNAPPAPTGPRGDEPNQSP